MNRKNIFIIFGIIIIAIVLYFFMGARENFAPFPFQPFKPTNRNPFSGEQHASRDGAGNRRKRGNS